MNTLLPRAAALVNIRTLEAELLKFHWRFVILEAIGMVSTNGKVDLRCELW